MNDAIKNYIKTHSKSQIAGFILTLLFGPLGLFYSNWVAALVLCLIAFFTLSTIVGPIFCWILSIIIGFFTVSKHNKKVSAAAALTNSGQLNNSD